jgi:hypothetical protein
LKFLTGGEEPKNETIGIAKWSILPF